MQIIPSEELSNKAYHELPAISSSAVKDSRNVIVIPLEEC